MKKNRKVTKRGLILSIVTYAIFILVYWTSFYELYTLCKLGRVHNNIAVLMGCLVFFVAWFVILIVRIVKKPAVLEEESADENKSYSRPKTIWTCSVIIII